MGKCMRGKWFLVYSYGDRSDAGLVMRDGICQKEIPLFAITEGEAMEEADARWREVLAEEKSIWEKRPWDGHNRPLATFSCGGVTPNPRLVFTHKVPFQFRE